MGQRNYPDVSGRQRNRMRIVVGLVICLLNGSVAAQAVIEVSEAVAVMSTRRTDVTRVLVAGVEVGRGTLEGPESTPVERPVKLVSVHVQESTDTINMRFRDREWVDASNCFVELGNNRWAVYLKGDYMIEAWVRDGKTGWIKDIQEIRLKVDNGPDPMPPEPNPPGPEPEPDPPLPPDGPFDGLAARVATATRGMSNNQEVGKVFADVVVKMKRFEILQISQAKDEIYRQANAYRTEYDTFFKLLIEDAKDRQLGWSQTIEWYSEVAKGLGVEIPQITIRTFPQRPAVVERRYVPPPRVVRQYAPPPPSFTPPQISQPRFSAPSLPRLFEGLRCVGST
jgi:hypothetical protein